MATLVQWFATGIIRRKNRPRHAASVGAHGSVAFLSFMACLGLAAQTGLLGTVQLGPQPRLGC